MSGCILEVFPDQRSNAESRHGQKDGTGHFQPKLMQDSPEGADGGANRSGRGAVGAALRDLTFDYSGCNAELGPERNFAHEPRF